MNEPNEPTERIRWLAGELDEASARHAAQANRVPARAPHRGRWALAAAGVAVAVLAVGVIVTRGNDPKRVEDVTTATPPDTAPTTTTVLTTPASAPCVVNWTATSATGPYDSIDDFVDGSVNDLRVQNEDLALDGATIHAFTMMDPASLDELVLRLDLGIGADGTGAIADGTPTFVAVIFKPGGSVIPPREGHTYPSAIFVYQRSTKASMRIYEVDDFSQEVRALPHGDSTIDGQLCTGFPSTLPTGITSRCDALTFPTTDLDTIVAQLRPMDDEARSALDYAVSLPAALPGAATDYDWRLASSDAERVVLLGLPRAGADPTRFGEVVVDRAGTGWLEANGPGTGAVGECQLELQADGYGFAQLNTEIDVPLPGPNATEITLLATESNCAGGQLPLGRPIIASVTETAETVSVVVLVVPIFGDCPSNPPFPITIHLDAPLGDRQLIDGSVLPGRPIVDYPSAGG